MGRLSCFGFVFFCLQSLLSRLLHHRQPLMEENYWRLKKNIFTSLIKIINISNCRQEKGGTKIWSVWFLRWHEVTHATTSIIKIVYSNWRPQIKNIFMFSMVCYIWRMFIRIGEVLQSQWVYHFSIFGSILRCSCFYQPFPKFCFGRSVYYM